MTKPALQQRFDNLGFILNRSRDRGYFNAGQRTCINMERAAILHAIDAINLGDATTVTPKYKVSAVIELKCQQVLTDFPE